MSTLSDSLDFVKKENLSCIPVPFMAKAAAIKWEQYQQRKPIESELKAWFGNSHKSNIAIVCGAVSDNLVVLDCDTEQRFYELMNVIVDKVGIGDFFSWTPVVKTGKGYHIYLKTKNPVKSMKFPALDIKAEGGYVIGPGSVHPSGSNYTFVNEIFTPNIRRIDSLKDIGIDVEQKPPEQTNQPGWVSELLRGVGQGGRNDAGARLAGYFRNLVPMDVLETLLTDWNKKNSPPLEDSELRQIIKSSERYNPKPPIPPIGYLNRRNESHAESERHRNVTENVTENNNGVTERHESVTEPLSKKIEDWVREATAWFSYEDLDRDLGIIGEKQKHNRRMVISRLKAERKLESHPTNNKLLRHINAATIGIDFKHGRNSQPLDIKFPFEIEKYFNCYKKNIVVVAGSPDSGKTAWLLNFIKMNQDKWNIYYQSSEMGETELATRLEQFANIELDDWKFTAEERSSHFADVIRPDDINIIDYMELTDNVWMVAEYLREIHDKLNNGIAIVALQKKRNAELGRGGEFSLEKPRLYLSMDAGKMTIQKAKNWASAENPNRKFIKFKIVKGCSFYVTENWQDEPQ